MLTCWSPGTLHYLRFGFSPLCLFKRMQGHTLVPLWIGGNTEQEWSESEFGRWLNSQRLLAGLILKSKYWILNASIGQNTECLLVQILNTLTWTNLETSWPYQQNKENHGCCCWIWYIGAFRKRCGWAPSEMRLLLLLNMHLLLCLRRKAVGKILFPACISDAATT